jgi:hypothetical protein
MTKIQMLSFIMERLMNAAYCIVKRTQSILLAGMPILFSIIVAIIMTNTPLDGQNSKPFPVGVGEGRGVLLGRGIGESVGRGLGVLSAVLALVVAVGITGSVPVIDTRLSRTRDPAEVVSSPKKRKFGVS